jgi:hypothetical protein
MKVPTLLVAGAVLALASFAVAQEAGSMPTVVSPAKLKFDNVPNVPKCAKAAPLHGDPTQGAFVLLVKATANCNIPRHWHTATEELSFVTGAGTIAMPNEKPQPMGPSSFVHLPAKNQHIFACKTACSFFLSSDGPFDIHYVDDAGQEISAEQALKSEKMPMKGSSKGKSGKKK